MKHYSVIFLGLFAVLSLSWTGIVLRNHVTIGQLEPTAEYELQEGDSTVGLELYPRLPAGYAQQGKRIYIEQGCVSCHTQQVRRQGFGSDTERGWGTRASVPRDYVLQDRVLIGAQRIGPDLADLGSRIEDANQLHLNLYNPRLLEEHSIMPAYRYLYEQRPAGSAVRASEVVLSFPEGQGPEDGSLVVATEDAKKLVAYLMGLKQDYRLPEVK